MPRLRVAADVINHY